MLRSCCYSVVTMLVLVPASLLAGGPPFLCLPLDGVKPDNVQKGTELLNAKLRNKVWKHSDRSPAIQLVERKNQWYMTFHMGDDIRLAEVNAALEGSKITVSGDQLHLFGHVNLEINAPQATREKLLSDLEGTSYVSIDKSKTENDLLVVTVDMPYPSYKEEREAVGWETFHRNDLSSTNESREAITADKLPSLNTFQKIVAKHDGNLKDVRWSVNHACRALGGVAVPDSNKKVKQVTSAAKS